MNEKRFRANFDVSIYDSEKEEYISASERGLEEIAKRMNEQQATINLLLEELVNAQQQGYVVGFLHKNEPCSLIPKELEDE